MNKDLSLIRIAVSNKLLSIGEILRWSEHLMLSEDDPPDVVFDIGLESTEEGIRELILTKIESVEFNKILCLDLAYSKYMCQHLSTFQDLVEEIFDCVWTRENLGEQPEYLNDLSRFLAEWDQTLELTKDLSERIFTSLKNLEANFDLYRLVKKMKLKYCG